MSILYNSLANVYEAMYQTFIDYNEEHSYYSQILKNYNKKEVLEIGSGTGNLATLFLEEGIAYGGLDASDEMITLARKKCPKAIFVNGDMRSFQLEEQVDSIIITARTISFLRTN